MKFRLQKSDAALSRTSEFWSVVLEDEGPDGNFLTFSNM
jgi:hypothetical protein